jgi:Secretion system C-terminal sorting domain
MKPITILSALSPAAARVQRWVLTLAALLFAAGGTTPQAWAQWVSDPNVNTPVSSTPEFQLAPSAASDGAGGIIVAWEDRRSTPSDIFAQRLNAAGVAQWLPNGIPILADSADQFLPMAVSDMAGGAIIVWLDERSLSHRQLFAQRINSAGAPLWDPSGIPVVEPLINASSPRAISDGVGGVIVTWEANDDIFAQRLGANGARHWTADGVAVCTEVGFQSNPALASDLSAGAVIAWHDHRNGTDNNVFAQRINAGGLALWTGNGVGLVTVAESQEFAALTTDGAGGAIVAWEDYRPGGTTDVFAQRVSGSGALVWGSGGLPVCVQPNDQLYLSLIPVSGGGAILTWEDRRTSAAPDIFAQRLNAAGAPQWTVNGVALAAVNGHQRVPQIVTDGADGAIVAWYDSRSNQSFDIFAQRVLANGQVAWTPANGVAISTPAGDQQFPVIVRDAGGGAILAWEDRRNGAPDIFAQQINASGVLGNPTLSVGDPEASAPVRLTLDVRPNPFAGIATVHYAAPGTGRAVLALYDASGRRILTLLDAERGAGARELTWDAAGLPSGVYLLRFTQGAISTAQKVLIRH